VAYLVGGPRWIVHPVDRSSHVTLGGLLTGAMVGFGIGWLFAVFRRAWRDLSGAQKATAAVGRTAWRRTGEMLVLGFLLLVVAALALGRIMER
jgi:hypothetical protein